MKIFSNSNIQKILGSYKSKIKSVEKNDKAEGTKDKIEISSKARDFQVAVKAFENLPSVRKEKIKETKNAIASGTYNPSAEEAIDKIFEGINFDKKI